MEPRRPRSRCSARCAASGASWSAAKPCRICRWRFARRRGLKILQAQHFVVIVVGEDLGVPAPVDKRGKHPLGLLLRQMVFEFAQETGGRGTMTGPLVEHPPDMRRQRDVLQQGGGE